MAKNTTNKRQGKNNPKVPVSCRITPELKDALKEKVALNGVNISDYLCEIIKEKILYEEPKTILNKVEFSPLSIAPIPISEIETKTQYDEELMLYIDPQRQEEYHRYINHLRKQYIGSVSDVITASLIATVEDEYRLTPKPFNHYLTGLKLDTYADNQPYAEPIQTINYRQVTIISFLIIAFLFIVRGAAKDGES